MTTLLSYLETGTICSF